MQKLSVLMVVALLAGLMVLGGGMALPDEDDDDDDDDALAAGTGWELVTGIVTLGVDGFGVLDCPPGKFVVNGGFIVVLGSGELRLAPVPGPTPNGTGWAIQGDLGNTEDAWAICVNP